jgi:hypothetical protein
VSWWRCLFFSHRGCLNAMLLLLLLLLLFDWHAAILALLVE